MTLQSTAGRASSGRLGLVGASSSSADRRKRVGLVAAIMGSFVAGLDATAVNVAPPAIRVDLGGGLAGQQWIYNAYLLALGSLILIGGSLHFKAEADLTIRGITRKVTLDVPTSGSGRRPSGTAMKTEGRSPGSASRQPPESTGTSSPSPGRTTSPGGGVA